MRIKRLRLSGFKSFVDPADLRIEPGLTGVVGPNGCGKSNLLEALRWTMGENSPRSMRGSGMEDVIFAGTATRPPRDFAEVALLAEREGADGPEESEIVRRIERGAGSAYRIDGREVRAKDVQLLFADAATGAHSPALVSQNRIGAVISAKPAERRAMLEEAAGIAGLHVRRRDAETRLRATEANLVRLDELLADQSTRIAALRRQARAAERYRSLSEQIRVAEARMIFARWRDAAAAATVAKDEADAAGMLVEAATATSNAARDAQCEAAAHHAAARDAALAARDAVADIAHRLTRAREQRHGLERRLAELQAARTRIDEDRTREDALAHDAADALARLAIEADDLNHRIAQGNAELPSLDAALAESERRARDVEVALAQAMSAEAAEAAERRVAIAAHAAAAARHERARREAIQLAEAIERLDDPAVLEEQRAIAVAAIAVAQEQAVKAQAALTWGETSEAGAREERDPAEAARAAALAARAALDGEVAALTQATGRTGDRLLDAVRAEPGFERALAAAMGDELETALSEWSGAVLDPADPPAPIGTLPLAARVTAPAELARRLSQVFVVEADAAQVLRAGQRLVTRDGRVRRWDGYVSDTGGAAAAERLQRLNRLAELEEARPAAAQAVEAAEARRNRLDERIARARTAAQSARGLLTQAEREMREAQRSEDRAVALIERLAGQRADLALRAARVTGEADEARAALEQAADAVAALPDGAAAAGATARLRGEAEAARAHVALARADRSTQERTLGEARARRAASVTEAEGWRTRAGEATRRIGAMDERADALDAELGELAGRPAVLAGEIDALDVQHGTARVAADTTQNEERDADLALRDADAAMARAVEALSTAREARAGATARAESHELRRVEMGRVSGERFECPAPLLPTRAGFDADTVATPAEESASHERLTMDRERLGPVNLVAEHELAELENAGTATAAERAELGQAVNQLRGSIGTLNREGRQRLLTAFEAVDGHFRRLFTTLFDGGQAHLALVDSDDPLEAGLEIMAQPPGKRLQSLTLLSGGEQALTAIALIFALFLTNPAPICVLDEVDAPLDDANVERFCDLLDRMTRETDTRYLIVTHNAVTMSRMHRLFGVTMVEKGVSRLVSVDLQAAELLAAE
ncbi:chromosome segregation protein [Sphingomonas sp. Leaf231]|uniref:chromosome segregation SMC family protein n=1 Tax=Sphingomonas sp. Leaf231 TaxID=1736301 RepID=UPI0006FCFFE0|nr:AAA family ATPase [Sphingomonas sp. Leaf231]KQN93780.1 chromosome segregation protein [Sphingomonas sp. Leaf231]